jgi:LysM domain
MPTDQTQTLRSVAVAPLRWAKSALTGTLLALAAVVPGVSIAAEPDSSQEGISAPEQAPDLETDSPGFDPGGETDLPFDSGPPPSAAPQDVSPDDGPIESEPTDDPEGHVAPFIEPDTPGAGPEEDVAVPPVEATPPNPAPAPSAPGEVPDSAVPTPPLATQSLSAEPGSAPRSKRQRWTVSVPIAAAPAPTVNTPAGVDAPAGSGTTAVQAATATSAGRQATPDRPASVHIVQPGESLWSIAEDLLRPGASAMNVAAQVAELWELNHERIPSGDPDLIAVGQRLLLR